LVMFLLSSSSFFRTWFSRHRSTFSCLTTANCLRMSSFSAFVVMFFYKASSFFASVVKVIFSPLTPLHNKLSLFPFAHVSSSGLERIKYTTS
jgi:hypothetical protein